VRGHESVLDHICVTKDLEATVSVLSNATTDHSPDHPVHEEKEL
jgi:hypothetical protein